MVARDGGDADAVIAAVEAAGVGVAALAAKLQADGAESFNQSWNEPMECVAGTCAVAAA